jgi:hypothetical protein
MDEMMDLGLKGLDKLAYKPDKDILSRSCCGSDFTPDVKGWFSIK